MQSLKSYITGRWSGEKANKPNGPGYDPASPEGALAGLDNLQKEESINLSRIFPSMESKEKLPKQEQEFLDACQFTMGLWSLMHLKDKERSLIWDQVDPAMKPFFDVEEEVLDGVIKRKIKVKEDYSKVFANY